MRAKFSSRCCINIPQMKYASPFDCAPDNLDQVSENAAEVDVNDALEDSAEFVIRSTD